jgi:hypothetical protein
LAFFGADRMTKEDSGSDCGDYLDKLRMSLNWLPTWFELL